MSFTLPETAAKRKPAIQGLALRAHAAIVSTSLCGVVRRWLVSGEADGGSEPRSTPQNRPYVDGSKPANGVGGVETRLGTTACGPPTARCGGWAVRRESKSPPAVVRRGSRPAAGARL